MKKVKIVIISVQDAVQDVAVAGHRVVPGIVGLLQAVIQLRPGGDHFFEYIVGQVIFVTVVSVECNPADIGSFA